MELAKYIEHTLLKPDTCQEQVKVLCEEAVKYGFKGICIPPYHVAYAATLLENTNIKIITVVGFPMGYSTISAKVEEVKRAVDEGADEIDTVINLCAVKDKRWSYIHNDIDSVTRATHLKGKVLKVILEMDLLNPEEVKKICEICAETGVDYVKTSTGYHGAGATVDMIKTLKKYLPKVKVKASGGIRTREQAEQLILAGANCIGTSAGVAITSNKK